MDREGRKTSDLLSVFVCLYFGEILYAPHHPNHPRRLHLLHTRHLNDPKLNPNVFNYTAM